MSGRFAGRVALVTGAASGIGLATARLLAAEGAQLALVDRSAEGLAAVAGALAPDILTRVHDVADEAAWEATEVAVRDRFGRLNLAVANAGVADAAPLTETSFDAWRRVLSANLDGCFLTLRCALRLIGEGGRGGAAVVVSSAAGVKAEPGIGAYAASKAGAAQLARVAAKEGAAQDIRVNAVLPAGVITPIWRDQPFFAELIEKHGGDEAAAFAELAGYATPLKRYATPERIAAQIAFLLGDECGEVTGAWFVADGGYTL